MRIWCHQICCRQGISWAARLTFGSPVIIFIISRTSKLANCEILRVRKWGIHLELDSWIFLDQRPLRTVMSRSVAVNGVAGKYKSPLIWSAGHRDRCSYASKCPHAFHASISHIIASCKATNFSQLPWLRFIRAFS